MSVIVQKGDEFVNSDVKFSSTFLFPLSIVFFTCLNEERIITHLFNQLVESQRIVHQKMLV